MIFKRKEIAREFNIQLAFAYNNCSNLSLTGNNFEESEFANEKFISLNSIINEIEKINSVTQGEFTRGVLHTKKRILDLLYSLKINGSEINEKNKFNQ